MSKLQNLFDQFADTLATIVKEGREVVTKDGEVIRITAQSNDLEVIRKFLADHDITEKKAGGKKIAGLLDAIETPFRGDEEDFSDDPDLRAH